MIHRAHIYAEAEHYDPSAIYIRDIYVSANLFFYESYLITGRSPWAGKRGRGIKAKCYSDIDKIFFTISVNLSLQIPI